MVRHIAALGIAALAASNTKSVYSHGAVHRATRLAARDTASLRKFVDSIRVANKLPGLALVVVHADGAPEIIVSGERQFGHHDTISQSDRMHLGSNTKAITATVIGALVERGRMRFETTIGEVFPELKASMQPVYRTVTVAQLLAHAGGIAPYSTTEGWGWFYKLPGTASEQRHAFAARLLAEKPAFLPGTAHVYSNAGVSLVGAMAERVTGRTYEQLVAELVFSPLGARAAFGNPGNDSTPQPFGHVRGFFGGTKIIQPNNMDFVPPKVLAPSGDVSVTLPDYGRFLQLHLRGLEGRDGILRAATIRTLHTPVAPIDTAVGWALGWGVVMRDGIEMHGHTGSAGAYIALASIQPARDLAIAIITNIGDDGETLTTIGKLRAVVSARVLRQDTQTPGQ